MNSNIILLPDHSKKEKVNDNKFTSIEIISHYHLISPLLHHEGILLLILASAHILDLVHVFVVLPACPLVFLLAAGTFGILPVGLYHL